MNNRDLFWLLVGFISGIVPILALLALYCVRSLKQVNSIKNNLDRYRASNLLVGKSWTATGKPNKSGPGTITNAP